MSHWPSAEVPFQLDTSTVARHLERVQARLRDESIELLLVTSGDRWLNEYTPRADNHRYLLSGFTGSTGLLLVPATGRARLLVDGRYHLQADDEVDADLIDVVKLRFGSQLEGTALAELAAASRVGYEAERVSEALARDIESRADARAFGAEDIAGLLDRPERSARPALSRIDPALSGRSTAEKIAAVRARLGDDHAAFVLSALDDIAWLTDARGYHFPHQASFAAEGLLTADRLHLCLEPQLIAAGLPELDPAVVVHPCSLAEVLADEDGDGAQERYLWDARRTNAALIADLKRVRPGATFSAVAQNPVVAERALKTRAELAHFESMNARSSSAIAETFRWLRRELQAGRSVTELAFRDRAEAAYADVGARDLSFTTIAAAGPSSAIIHFSSSSAERIIAPDDLVLLDSGAYYEGGFATDITRTVIAAGRAVEASARQRQIYTLVLKGLLRGMRARCRDGAPGAYFDALAREPLHAEGFDYAHGTGHGVGIHVHEAGVGFAPTSPLALRAGNVSSIEPGIYLEGFGGVRLENVVTFEADPDRPGFLRNRPLNFVGYDPGLIDFDRLDATERADYEEYQAACERAGTLLED